MITALALLLPGVIIASEAQAASETSVSGRVTVSGTNILIDGEIPEEKFFGVVDTTALQFAIMAYVNGDTSVAGKNSVFDGPDTSSNGGRISQNATANDFWHQYFALMKHYDCNLVRIGAGDSWGSSIQYQAWLNHRESYVSMLKTMCEEAMEHGVWVCLVLAGSQEYPAYQFGGEGSVFDTSSSAYSNYIQYCKSMMSLLENENAVAMYDMFNEPDHNNCNANYWHGDKQAFSNWASAVAEDTSGSSTHPRTMGVAGLGTLFEWSRDDFGLSTGDVGFEIAHRHYYASAKDSSLFSQPEAWADHYGLPLLWGELADNSVYPLIRHTYGEEAIWNAGGQAITSMVLTGTDGYPYTGGTLPDPDEPAYGNNNNNEENDTINNPEGNNSNGSLNTDQGSIDSSEKNESKGSSASLAVISLISAIVIAIALFTARKQ
ncbi:hypothetical protein MMINT_17090 [Candidatus Methanomassiliicoccus intestinalis Issoire-Mx1]|uniref:Uncharacterized protein n=2 Tax=Candidatus Methanomassiliicoccus intestinalis TaxID=1406512 RepID=R9TBB5_METII|nr:cellulase family glycosylhydrolase [Candidatus Methanomassiliicoccus intestinalis]AGN27001.1 hypothetical protein MMINT_17090 [Candidatus Methanomassiliicoccus intestinalis Issoire-Mx1]